MFSSSSGNSKFSCLELGNKSLCITLINMACLREQKMFQDTFNFFFLLDKTGNPIWKKVPFRISTAADDTISGKNTDTFKVYNYFLLIDPHMLSDT